MLKKILIGFGLLFGTLVAAGVVFWFGWLSPPDSAAVCENVDKVVSDGGEEFMRTKVEAKSKGMKLPKKLMDQAVADMKKESEDYCERFSKKKPLMMAQAVWVKRLKCMRDASNMDGLETCDEIKSF